MGTNDKKIGSKALAISHNDIQLYDKMKGNDYLIAFKKGKKDTLKCCQLTFQHYNFWHLLGCKIDNGNIVILKNWVVTQEDKVYCELRVSTPLLIFFVRKNIME